MHARQPLPRLWLMTDERQGEGLWRALAALPRGGGVVFRHHALDERARRDLFDRVDRIARRRGLVLVLAGSPRQAAAWRAQGSHGVQRGAAYGLRTASAHNAAELTAAERAGADLVFVSPVFATRSHPDARPLGVLRFALLAARSRCPIVALGGMNRARARRLAGFNVYGWAAIDAWT